MMKKRGLSFVLSAALAASLLVVPVSAGEVISETDEMVEETAEATEEETTEEPTEDTIVTDEVDPVDETGVEIDQIEEPEPDMGEETEEAAETDKADETAPALDTEETTGSHTLGDEYATSEVKIGEAATEDDLAFGISSYAVSSYDTVKVKGNCNYNYAYQILDLVNQQRA